MKMKEGLRKRIPKAISEGRKQGVPVFEGFEDEDEDEQFGRNEVRFPKIKLIKGSLILQFWVNS